MAQDHLNHKQEWKAAAKEVHLGEQCVIALHDESLLSDAEKAWLTGRLSREALVDGNPKSEDDRWAELLWLFTTRARPQSVVIRRPIATVLEQEAGRRRLSFKGDRVPLAVALAMRSRRGVITETAVERESRLLEGLFPPSSGRPRGSPRPQRLMNLPRQQSRRQVPAPRELHQQNSPRARFGTWRRMVSCRCLAMTWVPGVIDGRRPISSLGCSRRRVEFDSSPRPSKTVARVSAPAESWTIKARSISVE